MVPARKEAVRGGVELTAAAATVDTVAACEISAVPGPLLWPRPRPARHREPALLQQPELLTCAKHLPQPPESGFCHSQLEPDGDCARPGRYGRVGQAARDHPDQIGSSPASRGATGCQPDVVQVITLAQGRDNRQTDLYCREPEATELSRGRDRPCGRPSRRSQRAGLPHWGPAFGVAANRTSGNGCRVLVGGSHQVTMRCPGEASLPGPCDGCAGVPCTCRSRAECTAGR